MRFDDDSWRRLTFLFGEGGWRPLESSRADIVYATPHNAECNGIFSGEKRSRDASIRRTPPTKGTN